MPSEMVERCARAMCLDREPDNIQGGPHPHGLWIDEGEPWWTGYTGAARAVLDALNPPTLEMLLAAPHGLPSEREANWEAMLNAAQRSEP